MSDLALLFKGEGLQETLKEFPGGKLQGSRIVFDGGEVQLQHSADYEGTDGYAIRKARSGWRLGAASTAGFLSGLLNLADALRRGDNPTGTVRPRFRSRLYKHEANLGGRAGLHRPISELDRDFWFAYAKALTRLHFNGLVFYVHYHPFEYFLDYQEYPEAVDQSNAARDSRRATLEGLKRAFGAARAFGLRTFMQHYVTHFPWGLAEHHGICPSEFGVSTGDTRLAALEHPLVESYSRYAYRRTFELLPELSGLYLNFESAQNAGDFVRRIIFGTLKKMKRPPELVFRLWGFNSLPELARLVKEYPGKVILAHKIMDRSDAYYYPKADPRVIEWKKALPDTEFMFLVGPCHNCATVQSRILWADEDFMSATLADARKKGADSVAFHTVYELLSTDIPIERMSQDHEVHMSMFNRPHLDAVVDFALGRKPDPNRAARRYAERLDIALPDARRLAKLMKDISQVSMLSLQQTFITSSQEGYLHPYRASHYQEPFFYLNMSMANMEPRLPMAPRNSWLQRTHGLRNVPEDTQPIIDFVNPDVKKASRSPVWFARELRKVSKRALRLAVALREKYPRPEFDTLLAGVRRKRNWAERVALEIEVALGLYPLFFGVSKARALSGLRRAADAIERILPLVKKGDPASVRRLPLSGVARPEEDLKATRQLLRAIEKGAFPFAAFQAFGRSLERYNEIRRTVRPNRQVPEALTRRIRRLLREAHQSARASEAKLEGSEYRKNVAAWREYLDEELAALVPPEMDVYPLSSLPAEEGFVRLRHDQCFRHGENAIEDFLGFFMGRDWWPRRELFFRLAWDDTGLWVALKEDGADMSARRELWDKYAGSLSASYFLRVSVDREGVGRKFLEWRVMPKARDVRVLSLEILGRQHTRSSLQRPFDEGKVRWRETPNGYRLDYSIPWHALRGRPQPGESWRLNVTANPYIARNHQTCWCAGYEYRLGKASRMGKITFVWD